MAGNVHALLVGIDKYPDTRHQLSGCRNDVEELAAVLALRVPTGSLYLKTLLDHEATRAGVISTFRTHLGEATAGDTALFFYAGHGSRERAPEVFWPTEPDRLDETLVLWDSRTPGGWDLADKELAALIRPLAKAGVHVVVILDSCHSGSGTRAVQSATTRARRFPLDVRERPIETFLPEVQAVAARAGDSGWQLGDNGRHILLAACCDDQEAAESMIGNRTRGLFSYYLLEVLRETNGAFSYRDLGASVKSRVLANDLSQDPQIEATQDADLDRQFLDGTLLPRTTSYVASETAGEWWIDAGRLHGIPQPSGGENTPVALFAATASAADMLNASNAKALGMLEQVDALRSRLVITSGTMIAGSSYKAVITGTPVAARLVRLVGNATEVAALRSSLANSVLVAEIQQADSTADFEVECSANVFRIRRTGDGRELVAPEQSAGDAARVLEHITRWKHFAELQNPVSAIADSEFEVTILDGNTGNDAIPGTDVQLTATRANGKLVAPQFRVRVANRGTRDLYVAMLALDELYACSPDLVPNGVMKLAPGQEGWALNGAPLKCQIPSALRAEGRTESRDILKVIVSTASFDIRSASLGSLRVMRAMTTGRTAAAEKVANTLERLLARGQSRTISAASDDDTVNDFTTRTVFVTTIEPPDSVPLTTTGPTEVGRGVRIEAHPSLTARARLTSIDQTRADVGASIMPPMFRNDPSSETVTFSASRGTSPALSVLELEDVSDVSLVTPESPLIVHLPTHTDEGDAIMPIAFDGEDYLVLGRGGAANGGTTVTISRLPYPVHNRSRSLTGSIKILFKKFTAPILGRQYTYPLLAGAVWDGRGEVAYDHDTTSLRAKVAAGTRVVVWVHGIIGDSRAMGARIPGRAGDVYLTFDYENLHTTIEENAERLKERLADIGLDHQHGKELIIVAHSMGGLVTRWFMEKLSGRDMVSRVILCGTPNAGSNWSTIEDWITGSVTLAINHLTKASWEAKLVGALFTGLEKIDVTLDQMKPDSPFLKALAGLNDPAIPYTVLAGNTSLSGAADGNRVKRLLKKVLHKTASVAFLFEPNDLAVSVISIGNVGGAWATRPVTKPVACDHMSYFANEESVNELKSLLA